MKTKTSGCPASRSGHCLKASSAAITDHPACVDHCERMPLRFDMDKPDEYSTYLHYASLHAALYGALYLTFDGSIITIHDPRNVQIRAVYTPESHKTGQES